MPMTAANTMPVQTQQVGTAAPIIPPKASASILVRKKKKKEDEHAAPATAPMSGPATADMLMRRKK